LPSVPVVIIFGIDTLKEFSFSYFLLSGSYQLAYNNDFVNHFYQDSCTFNRVIPTSGGRMRSRIFRSIAFLLVVFSSLSLWAGDAIPKIAWKRAIGEPFANPGTRKPELEGLIDDGYWQGAPVGGLGSGTFSRTYRGDFSRWHLKAGIHKYETVFANQFAIYEKSEGAAESVSQVLVSQHPKSSTELSSWKWDYPVGAGNYYSLYPKSWFDYRWDKLPAHVVLEQFSPVLPDNYRESSYPVAVYRWHADNPTNKPVTVSVLLSWANMLGWLRYPSRDFNGKMNSGNFNRFVSTPAGSAGTMKAVCLTGSGLATSKTIGTDSLRLRLSNRPESRSAIRPRSSPITSGAEVWTPFSKDGRLANDDFRWTSSGETLAGAIAVRFTLQPGEKRVIPMVISWDLPVVEFGTGRKWYRHYTDFFGTSGNNAVKIAEQGLTHDAEWSDAIDAWQAPYVKDDSKPEWYRSALFNELYILADGGSFWGRPVDSKPGSPESFSFMECYDYPYYSTLDVRFYGSMPLIKFWPDLDKKEMRTFAETVLRNEPEKLMWIWKTEQTHKPTFRTRKSRGAVPHDLGAPEEDPFYKVNQFSWQNTDDWKDLNTKFVLMVYRDYVLSGRKDAQFLRDTWPSVQLSLEYLRKYDRDGDGIPENDGFPDQTYDVWVVRGTSAYCGGLWLGALRAAEEIAKVLKDEPAQRNITTCSRRARPVTSRSYGVGNISATTPTASIETTSRPTN
jgi:non-lysosomal glucosylceramidase